MLFWKLAILCLVLFLSLRNTIAADISIGGIQGNSSTPFRISMNLDLRPEQMMKLMSMLHEPKGYFGRAIANRTVKGLPRVVAKHPELVGSAYSWGGSCCRGYDPYLFARYGIVDPSTAETLFETMPNIPPEYINVLSQLDGDFADYVLTNAVNPTPMIREMDANTIKLVVAFVRTFPKLLAKAEAETIHTVFYKIPRPCEFLLEQEDEIIEILKSQYIWLETCFTAAFRKAHPNLIFTDYQLAYIIRKIPNFKLLMEKIPRSKWTSSNKLAVNAANMLLAMPKEDIRVLNRILKEAAGGSISRLKAKLRSKGSDLQGAFLLNLLLEGASEKCKEKSMARVADKKYPDSVQGTKKFMLSIEMETVSKTEYYEAVMKRKNWKRAFESMTYKDMAYVLTRVGKPDDFLSQLSVHAIRRCFKHLPKVRNVENFNLVNKFDKEHYPKTMRKPGYK